MPTLKSAMELTPAQWERVKELFETVLLKPASERSGFLAQTCPDPLVRNEVVRLLAHEAESGDFLSQQVLGALAAAPVPALGSPQSLITGDVIAGRFRVTRFLARGGMGEVYEAEDLELRERVALKTIRPDLVDDARAAERFRREVHLARRVTHPNVCRIFDLFRHQVPGQERDLLLVSMELLPGETLSECLHRVGRMDVAQALPIALQMASGLGAAHEVGVLHRDLKPGNVILVSDGGNTRAVITDFGLALHPRSESNIAGLTATGKSFGTPAYMSPEQVEGKKLTPASDVYALGIVLYQMITGTRPFEGDTPISIAVRRLKENPQPPKARVPDLDPRWNAIILRCLARGPEERFANGAEVGRALQGEVSARRRGLLPLVATAALLALLLATATWFVWRRPGRRGSSGSISQSHLMSAIKARRSVAVLAFDNLSGRGDTRWLSTALGEMLTTELAAGEKLRTIPGETVAREVAVISAPSGQALGEDSLRRLRQNLGADYVVLGSYLDLGRASQGQVRLDVRLQETATGNTLATLSERGKETQLDDLVSRAGYDLRDKLRIGEVTSGEAASLKLSQPSNPRAMRFYAEGLARLREFDALGARDLLQKACAADPNFALAHSALADAWNSLGYSAATQQEAAKADQLSTGLPREQRLWIQGRNWGLHADWTRAAQAYRSLFDFFPDNIEYGLSLADALTRGGKSVDSLAVLSALRKLASPSGNDPRIDLFEAAAQDSLANFSGEEAAAKQGEVKARASGVKLFLARALEAESRSLGNRGMWKEAGQAAGQAKDIYAAVGDKDAVARNLRMEGNVLYKHGDYADAAKQFRTALQIEHEIGNDGGAAYTLADYANALWDAGDWAGARRMYDDSLHLFRTVGDKNGYEEELINVAGVVLDEGELRTARRMYFESLGLARELGDKSSEGVALVNLGDIASNQGQWTEARNFYQWALTIFLDIGDQSSPAYALMGLGEVLLAQGNLQAAGRQFNKALQARQQAGEQANAAHTRLELEDLAFEQGKPAGEVESEAHQLLQVFREKGDAQGQVDCGILLVRTLLARHSVSEARQEMQSAQRAAEKTHDFSLRAHLDIATGQVEAVGNPQNASVQLREVIARTRKFGYIGLQLEAEEALAKTLIDSADPSAGHRQLATVQREAERKGYQLIAARAAAANAIRH
jgi:eukaryotic-like serine/threonine-protein kinase